MNSHIISFSIVRYNQTIEELSEVIDSILLYLGEKHIYLIDNSASPFPDAVVSDLAVCVEYHFLGMNVGFGKAHNMAIKSAIDNGYKYHFVVNPDIFYNKDVVEEMIAYMDSNPNVGQMMPKILYPNGSKQYLPKLAPTPWLLFWRKMKFPSFVHNHVMQKFEMREMKDDRPYDVVCLSGCFSVLRLEVIEKVGGYDSRYFMYFEDTDLARRIHSQYRTVYYPMVSVYHKYAHGAQKSYKLFMTFVCSCLKYFMKWGFFFDRDRKLYNTAALRQLK